MSGSVPPFLATDPDVYEHFMGRWSHRLANPFLEFAGIRPGDHVLDVGCGTGVLTLALAERGCTAVGSDASEPYLEGAPPPSVASGRHVRAWRRAPVALPRRLLRRLCLHPGNRCHPGGRSGRRGDASRDASRRGRGMRRI